jgi:hypothetical protein
MCYFETLVEQASAPRRSRGFAPLYPQKERDRSPSHMTSNDIYFLIDEVA